MYGEFRDRILNTNVGHEGRDPVDGNSYGLII